MEYNGGLVKAILRDSELLSEVNVSLIHCWLKRLLLDLPVHAAVSKIGAEALLFLKH